MGERTDQERGTAPETPADWVHDLEGHSDMPEDDTPPWPDTERDTGPPARDTARDDQA